MNQTTVKKSSAGKSLSFSPKYLMLEIELLSVMLELKNHNADTLRLEVACGKIKQNQISIQNQ